MTHRITTGTITLAVLSAIALHADASVAGAQAASAGTYELVEVGGSPLPAVVEESTNCTEHVTSARLELQDDGDWELEIAERETCGAEVEEESESEDGEFDLDGSTIRFRSDDDDDDVDDDDVGEIEVDELVSATLDGDTLRARVRGSDAVLVFRRI
ncbi:MAG: hypothetical protein ACRELV_06890 [Longimicrobiales bacterium]